MPPPSTRSNSVMPVGQYSLVPVSTSVTGFAACAGVGATGLTARLMPVSAAASTTVPHCWHSLQRPTHFAACQPHSVHR